jgi:alginate O-acetyltransferase complex protein AlgI
MTTTCDGTCSTPQTQPLSSPDQQRTIPLPNLLVAWAVLTGGLVGFWCVRPWFTGLAWGNGSYVVLYITSKVATLVCLPRAERCRLPWGRLLAYLFWPGMQPRQFFPEQNPNPQPAPTLRWLVLNSVTAICFLWILPALLPVAVPEWICVLSGTIGCTFLVWFVLLDAWCLLYRACGVGVEKLWHCPLAATSLADFWGRRWNRIFSGMFREVLFLPLARRLGANAAMFVVFLFSGLAHENFSVMGRSGYGLPFLYFLIQAVASWLESLRPFRRMIHKNPWLGRVWTAVVVLGPVTLLMHAGYRGAILIPTLANLGVPGL